MKTYNIGVTTREGKNLGFIVIERDGDTAYDRARAYCFDRHIELQPGGCAQRRDERESYNEWFERNYPTRVMML